MCQFSVLNCTKSTDAVSALISSILDENLGKKPGHAGAAFEPETAIFFLK